MSLLAGDNGTAASSVFSASADAFAAGYLNEFLAYDGDEIVPHGKGYEVIDKTRGEIVVDVRLAPSHPSHQFIVEQIEKCRNWPKKTFVRGESKGGKCSMIDPCLECLTKPSPP